MNNKSWLIKGYVDEPIPSGLDLVKAIELLKKQKNLVTHHYYLKWMMVKIIMI